MKKRVDSFLIDGLDDMRLQDFLNDLVKLGWVTTNFIQIESTKILLIISENKKLNP
jgi:hypothetical protein